MFGRVSDDEVLKKQVSNFFKIIFQINGQCDPTSLCLVSIPHITQELSTLLLDLIFLKRCKRFYFPMDLYKAAENYSSIKRNEKTFSHTKWVVWKILNLINTHLDATVKSFGSITSANCTRLVSWIPPVEGIVKLNINGSSFGNTGRFDYGGSI